MRVQAWSDVPRGRPCSKRWSSLRTARSTTTLADARRAGRPPRVRLSGPDELPADADRLRRRRDAGAARERPPAGRRRTGVPNARPPRDPPERLPEHAEHEAPRDAAARRRRSGRPCVGSGRADGSSSRSLPARAVRGAGAAAPERVGGGPATESSLTYRELDRRANGLAQPAALGVGPDVLVGLATERSLDWSSGSSGSSRPAAPTCRSIRPTRASGSPSCSRTPASAVVVTAARAPPPTSPASARDARPARPGPRTRRPPRTRSSGAAPEQPRVRHLHLGLDRAAQGRADHATRNVAACSTRPTSWFGFGARRRLDALPLVRLRLLGLGALGRAALRRPAGRRARTGSAARRRRSATCWCASSVTVLNQTPSAFRQLIQADARVGAEPASIGAAVRRSSAARRSSCRACAPGSTATATTRRSWSTCTASPRRRCT